MKYLVVLSLIAAVASAGYIKPTPVASEIAEIQEIIAAINSPSTDPATAAALEQLLLQTLGLPQGPSPISVGPEIISFPLPDGGAVTAEPTPVAPTPVPAPVVIGEAGADASPLVQIILNINSVSAAPGSPAAVSPAPAAIPEPHPVHVVEEAVNPPSIVPTPVDIVDVAPVHVGAPEPVVITPEPVQIGNPIIPEPIVLLPDTLN